MHAASIHGLAAQGALHTLGDQGHPKAEGQRVYVLGGAEDRSVRGMEAADPRMVCGRVPQLGNAAEPGPVTSGAESRVERFEPRLPKHR